MKHFKWAAGWTILLTICLPLALQGRSLDLPDYVLLDSMADLFEGAEFDHEIHVEMVEDCTECHHHTVGIPSTDERCAKCHDSEDVVRTVACGDCHQADPFSAENLAIKEADRELFHVDKPGLKAAYHLNCLGCHEEVGGPVDCQDCHERTRAGDAFYHSGEFAPAGEAAESGH